MRYLLYIILIFFSSISAYCQNGQDNEMNLDILATYGNMLQEDCIKEDISKTVFFMIPERYKSSFYIRVFDPDCGGMNDNLNGLWETNTIFEVFGGDGCICKSDTNELILKRISKSGTLLSSELFGDESLIDNTWFSFGPFKPEQGEAIGAHTGKFFKIVIEGRTGDDCNLYALFLSNSDEENIAIDGARQYYDIDKIILSENIAPESVENEFSISAEPIND